MTVTVGNTDVNVGPNQTICLGESTTVTASTTNGVFFAWNTGATTSSITVSPSTTTVYSVTVTDANGCTATDNMTVTVGSADVNAGPDQTICLGESTSITASSNSGVFYSWNTGATTQSINVSPTVTTTYSVTVTDNNGCTATDAMTVTVGNLSLIHI